VEDGDNTAMKVTVEEDVTSNTPVVQIVSPKPHVPSTKAVIKANRLSNFDLSNGEASLQNHLSVRDLSPQQTDGNQETSPFSSGIGSKQVFHHSLSPVRFNNSSIRTLPGVNHLFNSETSDVSVSNPALKKLQLHTYHIRDKNGSPTAQVAILRDF
jgi:hypothetical protein